MEKCTKCGMPLDEENRCSCDPSVCYHCCGCPESCQCGCYVRREKEGEE